MQRFSIDNRFSKVSLDQFRRTAHRLKSSLKIVRPTIQSKLLLTTNGEDYHGFGSLTISIPEVDEALARREEFQLADLNEGLWRKSFETELYIKDNSAGEPYMICLSKSVREPRRLFFYGQCLDETSQRVFDSFKKVGIFQKLGDGYHRTSWFALGHALSNLK